MSERARCFRCGKQPAARRWGSHAPEQCNNHVLSSDCIYTDADIDALALEPTGGWGEYDPPNETAIVLAKELLARLDWFHPHEIMADAMGGFAFAWDVPGARTIYAHAFNGGRLVVLGPNLTTWAGESTEDAATRVLEHLKIVSDKGVP